MTSKKDMLKEENIDKDTSKIESKKIEEEVIVEAMLSALEFALVKGYSVGIVEAVKVLDPSYKEDHYKKDWEVIFKAFMSKPENCNWRNYLKEYKGRK